MSNTMGWFLVIATGLFVLSIIGAPIYIVGSRVYPDPIFNDGQIVQMRLSGDRGMVVSHYCSHRSTACSYSIRFPSLQMSTNVSLFGSDGPIDVAPVALVRNIKEFELERERE